MEITVKEAAKKANVVELTVRNWINTGKLKAKKVTQGMRHSYLIDENDLKDFLQSIKKD